MNVWSRGAPALLLAVSMLLAAPRVALAHTAEGDSTWHLVTEMTVWGLGIVATLAMVVLVFWVRARLMRRGRP